MLLPKYGPDLCKAGDPSPWHGTGNGKEIASGHGESALDQESGPEIALSFFCISFPVIAGY